MNIQENISLKSYTTFMTQASSRFFTKISSVKDIISLVHNDVWKRNPYILGGGSNILFTKDYDGLIVINNLQGKKIINETEEYLDVEYMTGESWHECVLWSVENNLWGIENLVLIPGTIGASAVQNIGAYGVEVSETIISVEVVNLDNGTIETLSKSDCSFGYRQSIFKKYPEKYFITTVTYRLSKIPQPKLSYGSLQQELEKNNSKNPSLQEITDIISTVRRKKLPDVGSIGMAGSFFKNPIIDKNHFDKIIKEYPTMPSYQLENNMRKIPAGWIIETLGYKGFKEGNVGTYEKHALVLVNYGNATGEQVWDFAQKIMKKSKKIFNIELDPEVIVL
jgi:UDP-N-acetylmuramate dehydrogenase